MLQRIGRYEVLETLAGGGQGTVYLAQGESELALADLERAINSSQESPPHTLAGASHTRLWGI